MSERWQTEQEAEREVIFRGLVSNFEKSVSDYQGCKKVIPWYLGGGIGAGVMTLAIELTGRGGSPEQELTSGAALAGLVGAAAFKLWQERSMRQATNSWWHIVQLESEDE